MYTRTHARTHVHILAKLSKKVTETAVGNQQISFHFCVRGNIFNSITLVRGFRWGGPREGHLEDPGVDERIILRWISRKLVVGCGLDRAG